MIFIPLITFKKNFNSSNLLCVKINSATGYFKEKNDDKYLILDSTKEYESVWSEIKSEIKKINGGKEVFHEKIYCKVGINTEDNLPLNESLKFLTLTVNINLVLQENNKSYPQIYLNECFYELQILYKKFGNENKNENESENENEKENENENEDK